MSEREPTIQPVHEIPPPARFTVRGNSFQLDLLEAIYTFDDLYQETAKRTPEGQDAYRAYLSELIDYVRRETGVTLTFGEADWLHDALTIEFTEAKKKRRDSIDAARTSRSSTASTRAD